MNRSAKVVLALAFCAFIGGWLWKDDTAKILQQLKRIETLSSHRKADSLIARQMNASDMRELFSSDVSLTMRVPDHGEHTLNGRAEIMEAVTQIKAGVDQLALQFLDPKVTLEPDKQKAIVSTTLHVLIGLNPQQQEYFLEMKLAWNQTKDGWVVSRLETIKTFGR